MRQEAIQEASQFMRSQLSELPEIGLILGSGLGSLADEIENPLYIPYETIPHFPISTVAGHEGRFVFGTLMGKRVLAMQGRFHYYEGYAMDVVTMPVYVMKALGVESMIVTNACGGLNHSFYPGALMVITDHINFTGANPLIGPNLSDFGPRFPDMSAAYTPSYRDLLIKVAEKEGIEVIKGVYTAISGPNYLSKAELSVLMRIGSDAVGMSTVPEVTVAAHCGMKVLGISCVTDMAIPELLVHLEHEQVIKVANETRPKFTRLIKAFLKEVTL
jgi:purine-nucleoside phosphorylase